MAEPTPTYTLNTVQQAALRSLRTRHSSVVALQCGTGKTLLTLHYAKELQAAGHTTLFCLPKSAAAAYKKELATKLQCTTYQWCSSECPVPEEVELQLGWLYVEFPVLETYLSRLLAALEQARARGQEVYIFIDEAHVLCSSTSLQSTCLRRLRALCRGCIAVTASPYYTRTEHLFQLYRSVYPELQLFASWPRFRARYCRTVERSVRVPGRRQPRTILEIVGHRNVAELSAALEQLTITGALTYDVRYEHVPVTLDPELVEPYRTSARGLLEEDVVKDHGARLHDLQRVVDGTQVAVAGGGAKLAALARVAQECLHREEGLIVYVEYLDTAQWLVDWATAQAPQWGGATVLAMTGQETEAQKVAVERQLGPRTVLVITRAASQSRNLQALNNLAFYNIPYSIGVILQVTGRICRCDSVHAQQTFYLLEVERTIDTYKLELYRARVGTVHALLGAEAGGTLTQGSSSERLQYVQSATDEIDLRALRRTLLWW